MSQQSHTYERGPVRRLKYNGRELLLLGRHGPGKVRRVLDEYVAGKGPQALSDEYDAPVSTIEKWAERAGVRRSHSEAACSRRIGEGHISPVWRAHEAARLYTEEEYSTSEIGDELGVNPSRVIEYLKERGVETRTISEGEIIHYWGSMEAYKIFCRQAGYAVNVAGRLHKKVCAEHGISYPTLARALRSEYNPYSGDEPRSERGWWLPED